MHLQRVAILAALIGAGCSSSDTTTTTQYDEHGCSPGATYCSGCNGGGFCSPGGGCPGYQCPATVPDGGPADGATIGDATIADASGCASGTTACADCNGGAFCVSGACPVTTCPTSDAGNGGDAGPRACGDQMCGTTQLCVHPTCAGGVPVPCSPTNDAGACESGWTYQPLCQQFPGEAPKPGCQPPRCTDPPAFCIDIPATCGAIPMCRCLPADVCKGHGGCGFISNGRDVLCQSA